MTEINPTPDAPLLLDALGQLCPWPLVLSKQALKSLPASATLEVWVDDPMAELDLRALCAREGHRLIDVCTRAAGGWTVRISKKTNSTHL
jgi:tRNA 2-thiouridine synthesizing protein A